MYEMPLRKRRRSRKENRKRRTNQTAANHRCHVYPWQGFPLMLNLDSVGFEEVHAIARQDGTIYTIVSLLMVADP